MNESVGITLLLAKMALEFGHLNISHGQWIKSKFAGNAREDTFDIDKKSEAIIFNYLVKCGEQKFSKTRFLDECISMDMSLKHRFIYQELKKSPDVTQDDARRVAAVTAHELPVAGINELLSAAMKRSGGSISARDVRAALVRELTIEKEALLNTIEEMSKGCDNRMDIKLNQLLITLENKILQINVRLEK